MDNTEKELVDLYDGLVSNIENTVEFKMENLKELSENQKIGNLKSYFLTLNNQDIFTLFINSKIKVFSTKTEETNQLSESLFGENYTLKFLLNNREDFVKSKIWSALITLYRDLEENSNYFNGEEPRTERLELVRVKMEELTKELSKKVKSDIFNTDVNETTNNMIDDIVGSFQDVMNKNANPFENIMDITSKITEKYHKKIEDGEIDLTQVMGDLQGNITNSFGGMNPQKKEEKVVIDENFSTADVDVQKKKEESGGFNIGNMMKAANSMPDIGGLSNVMSKLTSNDEDVNLDEVKEEMDSFLSKELGLDMGEFNKNVEELQKKLEKEGLDGKLVEE